MDSLVKKHLFSHLTLLTSLTLGVVSLPNFARAAVVDQTGFEDPPFSAQAWSSPFQPDGWRAIFRPPSSSGFMGVTNNAPASGQQALQMQTFTDVLLARAGRPFTPAIAPVVSLSVDVRLDGPDTGEGIDADLLSANVFTLSDLSGSLGEILLSSNGNAYTSGGSGSYLHETPFTLGEYHNVTLISDFSQAQTDFFIDGQFMGSQTFNPLATGVSGLFLSPLSVSFPQANQYTVYYDNVVVETLPKAP